MAGGHGSIHWSELNTRDPKRAEAFYQSVLGWRVAWSDMGGGAPYGVAMVGDAPVAGIFTLTDPAFAGVPDHWMTYVAVADVAAAAAAATAGGGAVRRAPFDVPGVGRVAILADAGGAVFGAIQPAPQG